MEAMMGSPTRLSRRRSEELAPAFDSSGARRPSAPSFASYVDSSKSFDNQRPSRPFPVSDIDSGFVNYANPARPATPVSPGSDMIDPNMPSTSLFQNYLRALHPFDPTSGAVSGEDASLLTASMKPGDLILVHCVHANGWADGTVLNTGDRGWLPTNYCEAYDHSHLRNLLSALTHFWDLLGANEDANLSTFVRQDYIRGIIAGVRYLLERADCLHRDAELVKRHVGVRRMRKGLLADLSSLVQIAKRLQETISEPFAGEVIHVLLEELVTKAFKVVTRAVSFMDVWSQEAGAARAELQRPVITQRPATPPADGNALSIHVPTSPVKLVDNQPIDSAKCLIPSESADAIQEVNPEQSRRTSLIKDESLKRKSVVFTPPEGVVLHRLSHIAKKTPQTPSAFLASEQLAKVHDICISHIGAFIGHQLHSRPGSELIATTEKLVRACQNMLAIVDEVYSHDPSGSTAVQSARSDFEQKLEDLVNSTKEIFNTGESSDEDVVVLPTQSTHLINVGTGLIRNTGECVVKTRQLIEKVGDFELKSSAVVHSPVSSVETDAPRIVETVPPEEPHTTRVNVPARDSIERYPTKQGPPAPLPARLQPPPTTVVSDLPLPSPAESLEMTTPVTPATPRLQYSSMPPPPPPAAKDGRAAVRTSQASSIRIEVAESLRSSAPSIRSASRSPARKDSVGISVASSVDTSFSTTRETESRASTRATTPDQPKEHQKDPSSPSSALINSFASVSSFRSLGTDDGSDAEAHLLQKTYANELTFSKDGQVTGGSLPALVEQLTTHDSTPDPLFLTTFFLTFRKFTEPRDFAQALMSRYDYIGDSRTIGFPVRLRIYNVFKGWLETYWNAEADKEALGEIRYFALHKLKHHLPSAGERLVELTRRVTNAYANGSASGPLVSGVGKISMALGTQSVNLSNAPEPAISKSQLNALRVATGGGIPCNIVDLDPLEMARQLTLITMKIYCEIKPDELLSMDWNKANTKKARNVRAMCMINTDLAHVVGDTILAPEDPKKRALVIKQWAKVAMHCLDLNNYDSIMAIMCSINSSVVRRLKRTWEVVNKKTRARLEALDQVIDIRKNYSSLRRRLETPSAPCLPFLGVYLTDLTFVIAGNPKRRELPGSASETGEPVSVINFDMYMRLSRIIAHLQKYQVPYKLRPVPEMQAWIESHMARMREGQDQMVSTLHRRSIMIEPRTEDHSHKRPQITLDTKHLDSNNTNAEDRPRPPTSAKPDTPAVLDKFDFFFKSGPFTLKSITSRQELHTIDEAAA